MADDVSAGRLHLDAVADASGFARDAKAKIEAATKNLRAKIKVELDDRGVVTAARASAKKAQQAATVKLQAQIDTRALIAQAKEAALAAGRAAKVKIGVEIDEAMFAAKLTAAVKALDGRYKVTVGVDVDTGAAAARLAAFRQGQKRLPIDMGVKIDTGNLSETISKFSKMPALAGGIYLLVAAVGQLAGGLFAVVSSASQAVTALAALPGLVFALLQGVGALFAGLGGIGAAVQALGKEDLKSAGQSEQAAKSRVDAARAVASAQQNLADAYHQAADSTRQANYAVADAEYALTKAHQSVTEAQQNLNDAREAARQRIDELNDALKRAALTEEQATNSLAKARQALQDVIWDKSSTEQERKDAALAVKQAQQDAKDAKDNHKDVAKAAKEANDAGVKGSEEVKAARQQLADTTHSLMLAERQLAEAQHSQADTAHQNAEAIAAAQQQLADAQNQGSEAIKAQTTALDYQMAAYNKLSPVAKRFATFLFDKVMPRFKTLRANVQEALLPPLQRAITKSMPFIDTLEKGLIGTGRVIGRVAVKVGTLFGNKGFNRDISGIMGSNNKVLRIFGDALVDLIKALTDVTVVAGPTLIRPFAKWVAKVAEGWKEAARLGRETGTMADRFEKARKIAGLLGRIIGNIAGALHGLGSAAVPAGDDMLRTFAKVTARWERFTKSTEGKNKLRGYFESTKPAMSAIGTLLGDLSKLLFKTGQAGGGPLVGALKAIDVLVKGLTAALGTPGIGKVLGWILTLAGAAGGLGMVAGMMVKLGKSIQLFAKFTGITKLLNLFRASLLATRIQLMLLATWEGIVAGATAALNAVMALNPFVLIALGIVALVGLFVLLYKKVDWFHDAVKPIFDAIGSFFGMIVDAAEWLWDVLFGHSIFPDLAKGFKWFLKVFRSAFAPQIAIIKTVTWVFKNLGKIVGVILGVMGVDTSKWSVKFHKIMDAVKAALGVVGEKFTHWRDVASAAWQAVQDKIGDGWKWLKEHTWDPLVKLLTKTVPDAFKSARERIKGYWQDIQDAASKPIEFIINTVYNDGLRKVINAIPGVSDLPEIHFGGFSKGGVLPGYSPGRDNMRFRSPSGATVDLAGGESIMVPQWTRQVGPRAVAAMNAAASRGGDALATLLDRYVGGFYRGGVIGASSAPSTVVPPGTREIGATTGGKDDGGHWWNVIGKIKGLVTSLPGQIAKVANLGGWGSMMVKSAKSLGHSTVQWVNDKIPNKFLPNNPIPNPFDSGGDWRTGTTGVNLSGKTETVFTNDNMVSLAESLGNIARSLFSASSPIAAAGAGGGSPLVGSLTLVGTESERRRQLRDVSEELRVIRLGGVHAGGGIGD